MSRNPYSPPPMSTITDFDRIEPSRTSGLAVASIVTGLLCCLPGMGLLSTILGGAALVRISGSQGRLHGRGLAIVSIVLGLIGTIGWVLAAWGGNEVAKTGAQRTAAVGRLISSGDVTGVRPALSATALSAVTDEQFQEFASGVRAEAGDFRSAPKSMWEWLSSFAGTQRLLEQSGLNMSSPDNQMLPVPVEFAQGKGIIVYQADSQARGAEFFPPAKNIGVLAPNGTWIWLRPPTDTGVPLTSSARPGVKAPAKTPPAPPATTPPAEGK